MPVVLDVNILISFAITDNPPIKTIRQAWEKGQLEVAVCNELVTEYERVSGYKHLLRYFQGDERRNRLEQLLTFGTLLELEKPYPNAPDPDDSYLFAMLEYPEVRCLVTGDKALLRLETFADKPIMTPGAFVRSEAMENW